MHFPFCRRKCTYCALHSRAGTTPAARADYVERLAAAVRQLPAGLPVQGASRRPLDTIYFGGGSPATCDLRPLFDAIAPFLNAPQDLCGSKSHNGARSPGTEFTVELHPLDVTRETLGMLKAGGVNRISMGVQSLDDDSLRHMGRGYTFAEAEHAFALVREYFDNAGIDLIVGYPEIGDDRHGTGEKLIGKLENLHRLAQWGLRHCSVYSLILEEKSLLFHQLQKAPAPSDATFSRGQSTLRLPDDDEVLDQIAVVSRFLESIGLERYEISNYAAPGYECRHNMATWRGEDYIGLGDGAHGRIGLLRTENWWPSTEDEKHVEVSAEKDEIERRIFSLRTREGLNIAGHPEWEILLDRFVAEGLLAKKPGGDSPQTCGNHPRYCLTERGTEVCDTILSELV